MKKLVQQGKVGHEDSVVLILTGHALKDSDYTLRFHRGELLTDRESAALAPEIERTRRNSIKVEASSESVLRELERARR